MSFDFNYATLAGVVAAAEEAGCPISEAVLVQQAAAMEISA